MRSKIWLALSVLALLGAVGAQAYPSCSTSPCTCASSCTAQCLLNGVLTSCGQRGMPCGGCGGCTAAQVTTILEKILEKPAAVPVGGDEGRAAARLTLRLAQHVEERSLGEVYTGGTGFLLSDGHGRARTPELAFVSREHAEPARKPGAFRLGSPDLVAEFLSAATTPAAAKEDAKSWIAAGTKAVLVVDAAQKTVAVYRGGKAPQVAEQGSFLDLSDVVPGWSLKIDDLFE
jgi:Uma2 family endonuclease